MNRFKKGDFLKGMYSDATKPTIEIEDVDVLQNQYKLKYLEEGYSVRFGIDYVERHLVLFESPKGNLGDFNASNEIDVCKHEDSYIFHMRTHKSFKVCRSCKKDMGDA